MIMNILLPDEAGEESWIAVSDLMAGLMMVFLFIAVIYAKDAETRVHSINDIVETWQAGEQAIHAALDQEFSEDLVKWNAEIDTDSLTIRFLSPDILFLSGKSEIRPQFKSVLSDFFPRYLELLHPEFSSHIKEVRIEGHTSSRWDGASSTQEAFIKNMELSQERTRSVLQYCISLPQVGSLSSWIIKTVSANGLSSAKVRLNKENVEDEELSRRVEFRIETKTKDALSTILNQISSDSD